MSVKVDESRCKQKELRFNVKGERSKEQDAILRLQVRHERHMVYDLRCITSIEVRVWTTDKVQELGIM